MTNTGFHRNCSLTAMVIFTVAGTTSVSFADGECGPAVGGVVTCNDTSLNPYPNGITYVLNAANWIRLERGVTVDRIDGDGNRGVTLRLLNSPSTVDLDYGTSISTSGLNSDAVFVESDSDISIISAADINVQIPSSDTGSAAGLSGSIRSGAGHANLDIFQRENSTITATGHMGRGVYGEHWGSGDALAITKGTITTQGENGQGIFLRILGSANPGQAHIIATEGATIQTSGFAADALLASNEALGSATIESGAFVTTSGAYAYGAISKIDDAANSQDATVTINKGGRITTQGDASHAIVTRTPGTGAAIVRLAPETAITTAGSLANGIKSSSGGDVVMIQDGKSTVHVTGDQSFGVDLTAENKSEGRFDGEIRSSGQFGIGISSYSSTSTSTVVVGREATVSGGWQPGLTEIGTTSERPASGILIGSATLSKLVNTGRIEAGSDRAVVDVGRFHPANGHLDVVNQGSLTGFVVYAGVDGNQFINGENGVFSIRHFADTDGDGLRDTKRVSVSDFGSNTSIFHNQVGATVHLSSVTGETNVDVGNYYQPKSATSPLDPNIYSLNRPGVVQGQLVNLGTFQNSGSIDLTGPTTGNTLLITGNATADSGAGNGVFLSDGGHLVLNAVANGGGASREPAESYADVLVVDSTRVASGPTKIRIARRESNGSSEDGNGILLVEVRNKDASGANVFSLVGDSRVGESESIVLGAYSYGLYHNGVGSDAADGNWYLRKASLAPTVPVYESYPQVLLEMAQLPDLSNSGRNRLWINPLEQHETTGRGGNLAGIDRCYAPEDVEFHATDGTHCTARSGFWVHLEGGRGRHALASSASEADYKYESSTFQVGVDGILLEGKHGTLVGGANLRRDQSSATIGAFGSRGSIASEGYGAGAALTWYGSGGFYLDGRAQATWLKSDLASDTLGQSLTSDNNSFGAAIGLEAGQRIKIGNNWTLVPQAQLVYTSIKVDEFADPFGAAVVFSDGESLRGRLGAAVEYSSVWKEADGTVSHLDFFGATNVRNEFFQGTRVTISGTDTVARQERLWGGIELGATYAWNDDRYAIYGKASLDSGLAKLGESYTLSGMVGFKASW
ncbi:autotransporter outer membrane beta-barrel domain-containing protein [Agrobacterium sp. O3.4]|uniref:Autotransporter outer membrane beta-barrel domain-containing protein n=1 Tax=Agrobacterium cucumeris TaxID=2862866 RepID=A0ABY8RKU6_9HYPH|nr:MULTISPECIES: autotransporter outer membrane beta-barrel domain-containing protein [Rhizobium/Agrobacterium group]MCZ7472101.1 autotransporter outer membrane beta-barrel domain-containing protein [Rhizobium rhizogenes]WHO07654.1 autotransporter outer membrane beta-barrel domain-containing protein [Agrobacterium cucumeris]